MRINQKRGSVVVNLVMLAGLMIVLDGPVRSAAAQTIPSQSSYGRPGQYSPQPSGRPSQFGSPRQNGPTRQFAPQQQMNLSQNDQFNRQQGQRPPGGNPLFVGPNRADARSQGQFVDPRFNSYGANSQGASPAAHNAPAHSKFVVELTDSNFRKQVLRSKQPVLVDIWAPWCGPCKAISPMIDELAADYAGTLKVGKLNLDECPEVAKAFNVEGLPTLLIFNRGELVDSILGAVEREKLEEAIDAVMP